MTARLYRCDRCGYHYAPAKMARYISKRGRMRSDDIFVCLDRVRCDRHIAQRKSDAEALKR